MSSLYPKRDAAPDLGNAEDGYAYYEYHHGSGDHILMRNGYGYNGNNIPVKPQYSIKCIACHCVDCLILVAVLAFLGFSLYIAYYVLNNYGGG